MAILGTLVDRITAQSFAAAANGAPTTSFASHIHSLPATSPQTILPVVTSVQATAGDGYNGAPKLLMCGGNASVVTIGIAYGSGVTVPLVGYEVTSIVWHSTVA
jgi:hypothetical protein